jgi:GT2 family glycosyltransferase
MDELTEPIDILMTTYYRLDFTKQVMHNILDRTKCPNYRLIIVDNGSMDGTKEYLQRLKIRYPITVKQIKLLDKNYGLQAAKNIGMEYVTSKYFVNTDNDCLCPKLNPDWITQLYNLMQSFPDFAAIALRPQTLVGVGPIFKDAPEVVSNNVAGGSFRMMRTDLVKKVGGWTDDFENRQEEWNICTKLKNEGYKVGYARDIFCYHMFGTAAGGLGNWGYAKEINHYHNPKSEIYARDSEYNPETCEPRIRNNE